MAAAWLMPFSHPGPKRQRRRRRWRRFAPAGGAAAAAGRRAADSIGVRREATLEGAGVWVSAGLPLLLIEVPLAKPGTCKAQLAVSRSRHSCAWRDETP